MAPPFDEPAALDTLRRLADRQGGSVGRFGPGSRLEQDLRLTGGDALEFLEAASDALHIDMSGFVAADYVGAEAGPHLGIVSRLLGQRNDPPRELTMGDLVAAARRGRWTRD